jgi:uncharacterized protein YbjT (DUF2867 family)
MGQLDGRTAIVTGGSRGIGAAVVTRLVRDGAEVVFANRADDAAAEKVVAASAAQASAVKADLADTTAIRRVFDGRGVLGEQGRRRAVHADRRPRAGCARHHRERRLAGHHRHRPAFLDADHAFFNDTGQRYNASAASEGYRRVLGWFGRYLA